MKSESEKLELLDVSSSDTECEIYTGSTKPVQNKKLTKKKSRNSNVKGGGSRTMLSQKRQDERRWCLTLCKLSGCLCILVVFLIPILLIIQLWLRVDDLTQQLGQIEAGSRATPQELHGVHSQLQQLDRNSTRFHEDLQKIGSDLAGLTKQVQSLQQASESLQKSIAAAPQLATLPQDVQSLSKEIASIGSKTTVMETQVKELKAQATHADEDRTKMAAELKQMRALADQLQNQSKATTVAPSVANYVKEEMAHLDESVEEVNATLMGKVNWIVEDLHHHHELIHGLVNRTGNISNLLDSDQLRNLVNRTVQASLKDLDANQLQSHVQEIRALREDLDSVEKTVEQLLAKKRETSTTTASVRKNAAVRGKKASRDNPFADSTDNPPS